MDAAESAPAPWEDPQRRQAAEPGPVLDFNDAGYYPGGPSGPDAAAPDRI